MVGEVIHVRQEALTSSTIDYEQDALGNVMDTHEGTNMTQTITYDVSGVPSASGYLDSRLMWKELAAQRQPQRPELPTLPGAASLDLKNNIARLDHRCMHSSEVRRDRICFRIVIQFTKGLKRPPAA